VRHQEERRSGLAPKIEKKIQNDATGGAVQIARGLVRHEDGRLGAKARGHGDALLLAAGELSG